MWVGRVKSESEHFPTAHAATMMKGFRSNIAFGIRGKRRNTDIMGPNITEMTRREMKSGQV